MTPTPARPIVVPWNSRPENSAATSLIDDMLCVCIQRLNLSSSELALTSPPEVDSPALHGSAAPPMMECSASGVGEEGGV